jgi:thiamine pyrophosphate-dependent acetolactate synthase large subunit-like protein
MMRDHFSTFEAVIHGNAAGTPLRSSAWPRVVLAKQAHHFGRQLNVRFLRHGGRDHLPICIVIFNNNGIYRGTDVNSAGSDPATTVFVKGSRYDKMMEAFGGVGVNATSPDELKRAVNAAMDSGKPTLINAVIDPAAGSESGRIGNLNPQSVLKKK